MIKRYQLFEATYDVMKSKQELKVGDKVMVCYRDSRYYKSIGRIFHIEKNEDCDVRFDYGGMDRFFKTNLKKVEQIVELPTGEVFVVNFDDFVYLAATGILLYDMNKQIYTFETKYKWEVEDYLI